MAVCDCSSPATPGVSLNRYLPQLVNYTDVTSLLTYLIAEDMLTYEERVDILGLARKHRQIPELLCILMSKGAHWYLSFRRALQRACTGSDVHSGHQELLRILPERLSDDETSSGPSQCKGDCRPHESSRQVFCKCRCTLPPACNRCSAQYVSQTSNSCTACVPMAEMCSRFCSSLRSLHMDTSSKPCKKHAAVQSEASESLEPRASLSRFSETMEKHIAECKSFERDLVEDVKKETEVLQDQIQQLKCQLQVQETLVRQQKESFEEQLKIIGSQVALQSVEAEDVQKVVAVVKQSTHSSKLCTKKEKHNFSHFKLLLIADYHGSPDEIRTKFVACASTIEAIIGHRLQHYSPELGLMGTREMIFSECNVKVTLAVLDANCCSSIKHFPFTPDLVVYFLENPDSEYHQSCTTELTKQFTPNVWEHCVLCVSRSAFELDFQAFYDVLKMSDVSFTVSRRIPKVFMPPASPSIAPLVLNSCIAELCMSCMDRTFSSARLALIQLNSKRLIPADKVDFLGLHSGMKCYEHPIPVTVVRSDVLQRCTENAGSSNVVQQIKKFKPHFQLYQFGKRVRSS